VIEKVRVFQSEIAMGRKVKSFACIVWLCLLCVVALAYKCCVALRHFCISIMHSHTPEKYKAPNPPLYKSSSMASPSNPRKRTKEAVSAGRHIDTWGHLEGWFANVRGKRTEASINTYLTTVSQKVINTPKHVSLDWLKSEELLDVAESLEFQGLEKFLGLTGNIYPDLTKVFFTNLKVKGDKFESRVKGVIMDITPEVWETVTGLKCDGLKLGKGTIEGLEEYNKITFYRSCLRNPQVAGKGFQVGGLVVYPRILAFIIVWILTPRGHNHVVLH